MLEAEGLLESSAIAGEDARSVGPMAPRAGHFPAKAKRVIWIFVNGGPSQVDTWDYKPAIGEI